MALRNHVSAIFLSYFCHILTMLLISKYMYLHEKKIRARLVNFYFLMLCSNQLVKDLEKDVKKINFGDLSV